MIFSLTHIREFQIIQSSLVKLDSSNFLPDWARHSLRCDCVVNIAPTSTWRVFSLLLFTANYVEILTLLTDEVKTLITAELSDLEQLKFGQDIKMSEFIHAKVEQFNNSAPHDKIKILQDLKNTIISLNKAEVPADVKKIADKYAEDAWLLSRGKNQKSYEIKLNMGSVPVNEREQPDLVHLPSFEPVLDAMSKGRYSSTIDREHSTSSAFNNFKTRHMTALPARKPEAPTEVKKEANGTDSALVVKVN